MSAKNYQNRLMCVEDIACNIGVVFLRHSVYTADTLDATGVLCIEFRQQNATVTLTFLWINKLRAINEHLLLR